MVNNSVDGGYGQSTCSGRSDLMAEKNTPSFPRTRESIVPLPQCPKEILRHSRKGLLRHSREGLLRHSREGLLRHSREDGNPQFPHAREFIAPLPQCPKEPERNTPSFLRRRESTTRSTAQHFIQVRRVLIFTPSSLAVSIILWPCSTANLTA